MEKGNSDLIYGSAKIHTSIMYILYNSFNLYLIIHFQFFNNSEVCVFTVKAFNCYMTIVYRTEQIIIVLKVF